MHQCIDIYILSWEKNKLLTIKHICIIVSIYKCQKSKEAGKMCHLISIQMLNYHIWKLKSSIITASLHSEQLEWVSLSLNLCIDEEDDAKDDCNDDGDDDAKDDRSDDGDDDDDKEQRWWS